MNERVRVYITAESAEGRATEAAQRPLIVKSCDDFPEYVTIVLDGYELKTLKASTLIDAINACVRR